MRDKISFIRYPGGKQRFLDLILPFLPSADSIEGKFVEPFVGGGSVFFALNPPKEVLTDINPVLIDLYRGLKNYPQKVWEIFENFPSTKKAYYEIRDKKGESNLPYKSARTLYLNRTCFKGMWRENSEGKFNVGYGGQDRRWVIDKKVLFAISEYLKQAHLKTCDFEETIENCKDGDFLFIDPPYCPGKKDLIHNHYVYAKFTFENHKRLAASLKRASKRNIKWAITISSHPDILKLFGKNRIIPFIKGTGNKPGLLTDDSGEVLICNY